LIFIFLSMEWAIGSLFDLSAVDGKTLVCSLIWITRRLAELLDWGCPAFDGGSA